MCQFFSAILTREGDVRFCDDDSHEVILARLGWPDDRPLETRGWVRVECVPPHASVSVDETSVPAWYDEDRPRYEGLVLDVAARVSKARKTYDAACDKAWKPYDAACAEARKPYDAACDKAWKPYDAACDEARKPYDAACAEARKTYDAACDKARKPYDAACDKAWKTYDAACDKAWKTYDAAISSMAGYVGAK